MREWATVAGDALQPEATAERQLLELRIRLLAAECVALEGMLVGLY
ncbi:hypothetical protein [Hymenobacter psychrophilus]|nr:hypothetical protein [Hymenobacter psychrophilus]